MIVTFVIDENYVNQLLFVLYKCIRNSKKKHNYVVFFENLERASVSMIQDLALSLDTEVELRQIQDLNNSFDNGHIARSSMLRLSVPEYLGQTYMHFDVDTLPRKGWDEIANFSPSADEVISAVPIPWLYLEKDSAFNQALQSMGPEYFQTGIYLLNPSGWKSDKLRDRVHLLTLKYSELGFQFSDQCILNYSIQKCYKKIPSDYNTLPGNFQFKSTRIIHFAGPNKPWKLNYLKHFIISARHVVSARQTITLLIQRQLFLALSGYQNRINHLLREFFCLFSYRISYNKFRKSNL